MANESSTSISIARATVASALTFGILYAGCWLGLAIHFPVTHMFVSFFTTRPAETLAALFDGLCWSVLFGAVFGFVLSLIYNILPFGRG